MYLEFNLLLFKTLFVLQQSVRENKNMLPTYKRKNKKKNTKCWKILTKKEKRKNKIYGIQKKQHTREKFSA